MGFSTANKNAVLDLLFGAVALTPPGTYYVGLSTTQPADDGSNITEPSSGGSARISMINDGTKWIAAGAGEKSNAADIIWSEASALWGTIGWWVLMSVASGGTMHHWGKIQTPRVIDIGDTFRILAGDLSIQLRSE